MTTEDMSKVAKEMRAREVEYAAKLARSLRTIVRGLGYHDYVDNLDELLQRLADEK